MAVTPSSASAEASSDSNESGPHQLIEDLPGLKAEHARSLTSAGVLTVENLVESARSTRDRMFLAAKTGLSARRILEILDLADFARIDGLDSEAIRTLRLHGVHSTKDLARLDPAYLVDILSSDDEEIPRAGQPDIVQQAFYWIAQARELPSLLD